MGVAIDQPRRHPAPVAAGGFGSVERRRFGLWTGVDDDAVGRRDQALFDHAQAVADHRGQPRAAPNPVASHRSNLPSAVKYCIDQQ
jgi:hypothetical protein